MLPDSLKRAAKLIPATLLMSVGAAAAAPPAMAHHDRNCTSAEDTRPICLLRSAPHAAGGVPENPPAGYFKRCGDAAGATQVMHHDEDCRTAKRIAVAYSRDNPDPEGWSCVSRGRGITAVAHTAPEAVVTCSKAPGAAVRVIRFQRSACPGTSRASSNPRSRRSDDWPGVAGYTTIVASLRSAAEARRVQDAVCDKGLAGGVLFSTNYRSLRPGFWVVFSGTSRGRQEASRRTAQIKSRGYRSAYTRFVR